MLQVARRARTHHEKVMARFTPSPEGSDDEQDRRTNKEDRRRGEERRRDRHDSRGDDRREGRGRKRHDSEEEEEASKEEILKEADEVKPDVKDFKTVILSKLFLIFPYLIVCVQRKRCSCIVAN